MKRIVIKKNSCLEIDKFSSNTNEAIRAVLNPLLFFYEKISHAQKAQKAQKRNQVKAQNATSEQI